MSWKEKLSSALAARGISAAEVGRRLNIHRNTAANFFKPYDKGGSDVSPDVLWQLCQWAGVSSDDVLDDARTLTLEIDSRPRASGVARVTGSADLTEQVARLDREAKRHKKRPDAPGSEPLAESGGKRPPRKGGGKGKVELG